MWNLLKIAAFAMDEDVDESVVTVEDAATPVGGAQTPSSQPTDLQKHDARFHPNGYKAGDACKYRDALAAKDKFDTLGVTSASFKQSNSSVPRFVHDLLLNGPDILSDLADEIEDYNEAINLLGQADPAAADIIEERDKEIGKFEKVLRDYGAITDAVERSKNPVEKPKMNELPHTTNYPKISGVVQNPDGSADVTFVDYNGQQETDHFTPTAMGGTGAMEGIVTINGVKYPMMLKVSNKQSAKYPIPPDALKNEYAANMFLRNAGVNAPDGNLYDLGNGEVAMLTDKIENTTPLNQVQMTPKIQEQLREAYPLLDVMYSTDAFRSDNIRVDQNGKVWFVDNGASFEYKGKGDKREKSNPNWQGFEFAKRDDAYGKPDADGYDTSYGALYGSSRKARQYLGKMSRTEMLQKAAKYDMEALVGKLPKEQQSETLKKFAKSLDEAADFFRHAKANVSKPVAAPSTAQSQVPGAAASSTTAPSSPAPQTSARAPASSAVGATSSSTVQQSSSGTSAGNTTSGSTTPSSVQATTGSAMTAATGASASKAAGHLSAMGAKNPRMAALYSQVAAKLAGKPVQQQTNSSGSAQQSAGAASTKTPAAVQQQATTQTSSTPPPQSFNHKGMKHLQALIAKNPHFAKTYQAAMNKLSSAGIK